jgi:hypothetical protein
VEKRCKKCGELKPFADFHRANGTRDGLRGECKSCHNAAKREWYARNRDAVKEKVRLWQQDNPERHNANRRRRRQDPVRKRRERDGHLRRTFGITIDEYEAMFDAQGGRCGICRREPHPTISLHVDHDHERGHLRGLICFDCNAGLGKFRDRRRLLAAALRYLDAHDPDVQQLAALTRRRIEDLKRPA